MSNKDIVPEDGNQEVTEVQQHVPRAADDPFSPQGLPLALLEFHSPSAALVNLPPTASARYIIWLVGALFFSSLIAASVFPLNKVVSTPGRLVAVNNNLVIQPMEMSIIRSIDVELGQYVKKGQVLAHLDPTITKADIVNLKAQRDSYQATINRLHAEAEGKTFTPDLNDSYSVREAASYARRKAEYTAKVNQFDQEIASLQSQINGSLASAAMHQSRGRVANEVLQMRRRLQADQVGSKLSTLAAQSELMDAERAQIEAQQTAASTKSKLAAIQAERDGYIESWKAQVYTQITEVQHRLDESVGDYEKAALRNKLVLLKSPDEGVVLNIAKLSVGSVISPAQVLMSIVPTGAALEVEAVLKGNDAGFVKLGDHALLKFATFPYTQYGGAEGTVRLISADAFTASDAKNAAMGQMAAGDEDPSQSGYYRVRLRIDRYTLHGVPSFFHPTPGMSVSADIQVGKRTMIQWLFSKVIPAMSNGMREPN
ncbi:HlyD family type I secretion periplasmic adaptor subunit [Asaia bogorensis]|uniref:Membrane fusion protein (MFP) family protein n=1 Tax=Asaia bogorensis NBRC 16594 TaxID=1231624 RepID=A0AAN4R1U6_9PROT|nr:HlyD family type I secretion periplasmic adaptor subunit [Asaia bogorensis]MDR6181245.1 hemolysin D [Asaia bogorensis NBRC 16594]BAT18919.1 ABC transporter/major facilitator superfamily multidrug resistance transporter HlyD/EmrA/FusE protein [Asaia bogorensis NBRC 16594]GBQ73837.1 major facilitator superfamily multidrug resistance transporter EmrA/FusE [Asaia bogorensis NBRC 16594]GEL53274.1 RTX toxin transporter [Asaia bogorensis NBRC 16594]